MISQKDYKPRIYYTIILIVTTVLWCAGAYIRFTHEHSVLYTVLMLSGLMAPFLVSLAMIFRSGNPGLKKDFIHRLFNLKIIRPSLLPFILFSMPLTVLASVFISFLFGQPQSQLQLAQGFSFSGFVPVLLLLLMAAVFEELGWRGYAFDSLQSRYTLFKASILFSVLWSLWHLPLVLVKQSYQYNILIENPWYAVNFFVSILPMGVIISWVCIKNGKSVLSAILFHFIINMSQEMLEITQVTKCIETVLLLILAAWIIVRDKDLFFSTHHLCFSGHNPQENEAPDRPKRSLPLSHALTGMVLTVFMILPPLADSAERPPDPETGFSGKCLAGFYAFQTDSRLSTDDDNRRIQDLNGPSDTYDLASVFASIDLMYRFENGTKVYAGNPLEDSKGLALAAGVSRPSALGTLDVALTWAPFEEVWKNPYDTTEIRETSDVETYGLRVQWEQIAQSPFNIEYSAERTEVEDDVIASLYEELERSGWTHEMAVSYGLRFGPTFSLTPEAGVTFGDIEGKSNRYHGFTLGAKFQRITPPWVFIGMASGSHQRYQKIHPLFGKTRRETGMTAFVQAIRLNLFNVERLFASFGAGCIASDSNIDFYDSRTAFVLAGVGFNF